MTTNTDTRVPPQDLGAEQALLGAILLDNSIIPEVRLNPSDFYRQAHARIFDAMRDLDTLGTPVDLVTLLDHLMTTGQLEQIGGEAYIASLAAAAVTSANHPYHAAIVREKADYRRVIRLCAEVTYAAYQGETLDSIQDKLYIDLQRGDIEHKHIRDVVVTVSDQADRRYQARRSGEAENISGIPTGFIGVDAALDGAQPGELIIIGGDTGMGKSALMGQIARHAGQFVPVHVNNLEMTAERNVARMVADAGDITAWRIRKAWMRDMEQWGHFASTLGVLGQLSITFDDRSMQLADIRQSMVRAIKRGAKLLVLDYLQLVSNPEARTAEEEIGSVSKMLKQLAKNYKVAVIGLTSLNRALAGRTNKRPLVSDLRGSGQIEYDADVIIFVYRESKYTEKPGENVGMEDAELIITKGRDILEGTIKVRWDGERARFLEPEG